jgi:hypothetical protein
MPQARYTEMFKASESGPSANQETIPAGYIKCMENIWMDSYTMNFVLTKTTIEIAVIPEGRKISGIQVMIETSVTMTNGALALGFATDALYGVLMGQTSISHNLTAATVSMPGVLMQNLNISAGYPKISGFHKIITGTQTTICVQLNNWTMSTGTIKSIVRYT